MKVAVSPRVYGDVAVGEIPVQHPTGSVTFASFERIVRGMKQGGELPEDWNIVGVTLEPNGLVFTIGPKT